MIRFYRALLHLYPASFRKEYGDEMLAAFEDTCAAATSPGRLAVLLKAAAEEVPNAAAVHWAILMQDVRYTARTLNRSRGFALTVILVTALGVGANTAAFSVADFVLFRPLPFADPDSLVRLCEGPRTGGGWGCMHQLSPANYRDLKAGSSSFEAMGAFASDAVNLVGGGEPRRLAITPVTPEVLPLLGVPPALGRVFETGRDDDGVVISHGLWQSQFGGDRAVLGRTVTLNGAPYTIIGVMPSTFHFPGRGTQMWTALVFGEQDFSNRDNSYIEAVGRLRQGVTFEEARTDLTVIAARLSQQYPRTNAETGISFFPMRDYLLPRNRLMLMALGGATLCLLLLTCANLASLLLARATARERELALRAALGAGRERLVRQLITESVLLALLGGAAGILVATSSVPLFSTLVPSTLPVASQPGVDLRVLGFAAVLTGLTALGFGLIPAVRAGGRTGFDALRDGSRAGTGRKQRRLRAAMVTIEVTMSVILLITSGLLLRAVWRVQAVEAGFVTDNVLTLKTALPRPKYDHPLRRGEFYSRVLTGVRALPGVRDAAFVSGLPMVMTGGIAGVEIPGQPVRNRRTSGVSLRFVTPGYFRAMGIPIHRGRDIEDGDTADRAWVAVVSESFGERYWPGEDPIGRTFVHLGRPRTIVGVVGEVRVRGLERTSEPQMYLPAPQVREGALSNYDPKDLVIRHSGQSAALMSAVRQIVREADPDQPISDVHTLHEVLARDSATRRAQLQVLGLLAAVALVLSGVGIYGLLGYTVAQRSQEIAVRLALGAEPSGVARMIFADGMRLAAVGIVPGVLGAYAAARAMSALLFGIQPGDPATFGAAIGVALLMTLAGSLVPALRAVRIAPMLALRAD
jgi:putative ABC transport system permease protein